MRFQIEKSKCDFFMENIKYLRYIIDKDGRRPDQERAAAIKDMPAPENASSYNVS